MPYPASRPLPGRSQSTDRGFTLIELLAVIAIIGILAAIIISVVGSVRASARSAQSAANLRSIGIAALSYGTDNKLATPNYSDNPGLVNGKPVSWYMQLAPYVGADLTSASSVRSALRIFMCPSSVRSREDKQTDVPWTNFSSGWPYISDYGYNSAVNSYSTAPESRRLTRFTDPVNPAQTPLIHEIVSQNNFYAGCFNFPKPASDLEASTVGLYRQAFTQRHNGGGHILWFDGSVKWMKYDDYMALANRTTPWLFVTGGRG